MAECIENGWLENLRRQAGIRRALLVHGSVNDACYNPIGHKYQPMLEVVVQVLENRGFDRVIVWDRFAGARSKDPNAWSEMEREASCISELPRQGGVPYDTGSRIPVRERSGSNASSQDVRNFLAVVCHHMLEQDKPDPVKKRYAFVLDWSQYLFGNTNSLSEDERVWLLMLGKAIRDAPVPMDDAGGLSKPTNMVVLFSQTLGGIPPSLCQGNPATQEILVPFPGRLEREKFLERSLTKWQLRLTPKPGEIAFSDFVDSLEGFTIRDMQQLLRLSRQVPGDALSFERLINLYKFGEQKSPWEDLNREKLKTIKDNLSKRVIGQEEAVQKVEKVIIRAYTGLSGLQHSRKQKMPKGTLFFVGPTGVGKTELAKALAQFLFGDEDACVRFDMTEYNHEHSDQRLLGAPPGYVGFEEGGQLTNAVKKRPFSVLLFDEIEKAHVRILDKFLQILEDGRLTDGRGETVHFSETVIIFTSNIGASKVALEKDHAKVKSSFMEEVRSHFVSTMNRPELLSRIGDNVVPFNFITGDNFLVAIARAKLQPLRDRLKEKYRITNLVFEDEDKALKALVATVDRQMGGRGVINEIVTRIFDPLAMFLFDEEEDPSFYAGREIRVCQLGKEATFYFEMR